MDLQLPHQMEPEMTHRTMDRLSAQRPCCAAEAGHVAVVRLLLRHRLAEQLSLFQR